MSFRIYRTELADAPLPDDLVLRPEESRHIRARRLTPGAPVRVHDGRGRASAFRLAGDLRSLSRDPDALSEFRHERSVRLWTAVPEGRRWDWLLQKATELGVTEIQPVRWARSEGRGDGGQRSVRIIEEAAVQSCRFVLPALRPSAPLSELLAELLAELHGEAGGLVGVPTIQIALDPLAGAPLDGLRDACNSYYASELPPVRLAVGPEGGVAPEELEALEAAGFARRRLGAPILRVETAALAGLAWLAALG